MKYIIGNWKMNLGIRESVALSRGVLRSLRGQEQSPEVVLCPSFTALSEVHKVLARSRVGLGAQTCGLARSGAFTGEVAPSQLEDVGVTYVIVGHSERRMLMHESDELVQQKMELLSESKLVPILCVGEPLEVREGGEAFDYVRAQLQAALAELRWPRRQPLMVAYEPIWAIGSGEPAAVGDIVAMHQVIRDKVKTHLTLAEDGLSVLYGGSVTDENAYQYLRESEIDGLLVGGASLKLKQFSGIITAAGEVIQAQTK